MGRELSQDEIDEAMALGSDPDDFDIGEWDDMLCGLGRDGQCSQAGTEHCDFECPNRNSELFAGSEAWRRKHDCKRKA